MRLVERGATLGVLDSLRDPKNLALFGASRSVKMIPSGETGSRLAREEDITEEVATS